MSSYKYTNLLDNIKELTYEQMREFCEFLTDSLSDKGVESFDYNIMAESLINTADAIQERDRLSKEAEEAD